MMPLRAIWMPIIIGVFAAHTSQAQDSVDGFLARTYTGAAGETMPYRLFIPAAAARARALPLIVYLHGGGGAGNDNLRQISGGNTSGTHVWTTAAMQARHPAFVVAPQMPVGRAWSAPDSDERGTRRVGARVCRTRTAGLAVCAEAKTPSGLTPQITTRDYD